MNLAPAKWIWMPSRRCLPNTFVLFRRELNLDRVPAQATGWLTADSRYRLTVNGERIQWGPAPCDPRWQEADPFDIAHLLRPGQNVAALRRRGIPLMREQFVEAQSLADLGRVIWRRNPDDWFESRMPDCFEIKRNPAVKGQVPAANEGFYFTYEMPEQLVGFPRFVIEAPVGTIVELMVQESHDPENGPLWLDSYLFH